jgi:hypothetical protein
MADRQAAGLWPENISKILDKCNDFAEIKLLRKTLVECCVQDSIDSDGIRRKQALE